MKQNTFFRQLTEYFEVFLPKTQKRSIRTISAYADAFAVMFQFFQEQKNIPHYRIQYKNFTPALFDEYLLWLNEEKCYSEASTKQRITAITAFLKYASRRDISALSACSNAINTKTPSVPQTAFPYFIVDEMQILLSIPSIQKYLGERDRALLSLLYDSAARAQELCDLRVGDVRFGSTTKVKLTGKGNKSREVPISEEVTRLLRSYLKSADRTDQRTAPLFSSQTNDKMTPSCVRSIVNKYVSAAKQQYSNLFPEPKYSPHSFRHSKAVHMVESGVSLIYIRNFLGHSSVESTERYARVGQEKVTEALMNRKIPRLAPSEDISPTNNTIMPACIENARNLKNM
jgi:site-specific recombinase XerD